LGNLKIHDTAKGDSKMEYVYAALILHATGKEVSEEGVTSVLNAAGATVNEARAKGTNCSA